MAYIVLYTAALALVLQALNQLAVTYYEVEVHTPEELLVETHKCIETKEQAEEVRTELVEQCRDMYPETPLRSYIMPKKSLYYGLYQGLFEAANVGIKAYNRICDWCGFE